jgi:hypothetical protein
MTSPHSMPKRWRVLVTYLYPAEPNLFEVEELHEIHDRIERGPDWRAIDEIKIELQRLPDITQHMTKALLRRGLSVAPTRVLTAEQVEAIP